MTKLLSCYLELKAEAFKQIEDGESTKYTMVFRELDGDDTFDVEVIQNADGLTVHNVTTGNTFTVPGAELDFNDGVVVVKIGTGKLTAMADYLEFGPEEDKKDLIAEGFAAELAAITS